MNTVDLEMTVNSVRRSATVPARTLLSDLLRDTWGLTGTHVSCDIGVCGACTVRVDGGTVRACTTLAASCDGSEVTTIEGLTGRTADTFRSAMTREHGLQCGFCTPGMVMSCVDILERVPDLTEDRIRTELAGNLCRCTGYAGIVKAVQRARGDLDGELGTTHSTTSEGAAH